MAKNIEFFFTSDIFESLLPSLYETIESGSDPEVDLSPYTHLDLGALTNLIAFGIAVKYKKLKPLKNTKVQNILLKLPDYEKSRKFLFKMKFFGLVALEDIFVNSTEFENLEIEHNSEFDSKGRGSNSMPQTLLPWMPFQRIVEPYLQEKSKESFDYECKNFIMYLTSTFNTSLIDHIGFAKKMADGFWIPNKEIVENIYKHSGSWGYGAIQCLPNRVIICYADTGLGIRQTLEPQKDKIMSLLTNCRGWNDGTAILGAFVKGLSRLPRKSMGLGLHYIKKYVLGNFGTLEIRSGTAKVILFPSGKLKGSFVPFIPGVQIRISLPNRRSRL